MANGTATTQLVSNATGVVAAITPMTTTKPVTMSYSIWGQRTTTAASFPTPFGYQGSYTDPSGLVFDVNRYYDPTTAQFLTVDPAVSSTGQPYTFAGGDPANATDPTGLSWFSTITVTISAWEQDVADGNWGAWNTGPGSWFAGTQVAANQSSESVSVQTPPLTPRMTASPPPATPRGCSSSVTALFGCTFHALNVGANDANAWLHDHTFIGHSTIRYCYSLSAVIVFGFNSSVCMGESDGSQFGVTVSGGWSFGLLASAGPAISYSGACNFHDMSGPFWGATAGAGPGGTYEWGRSDGQGIHVLTYSPQIGAAVQRSWTGALSVGSPTC